MPIKIDCNFPGGNIVVDEINGDEIKLHQDLRDTTTAWFYWYFKITGAAGRNLRFTFTETPAIGARGPAVSTDAGVSWHWIGKESVDGNSFKYTFPSDAQDTYFSFGMPYLESNWNRFAHSIENNPLVKQQTLCTTNKNRTAELLRILSSKPNPKYTMIFTCRHHCCEMMASYALEGMIKWLVADNSAEAAWLRENTSSYIVPFVDKDGVENGDQGKNRKPRDHNRDYVGESIYAETSALRKLIPEWTDGKPFFAMDIHCPYIAGPTAEDIYLVGSKHPLIASGQQRLSAILEAICSGPIPFKKDNFLAYGTNWNVPSSTAGGRTFAAWTATLPNMLLATSMELPYANASNAEVNQTSALLFGRDAGKAISRYLQENPDN